MHKFSVQKSSWRQSIFCNIFIHAKYIDQIHSFSVVCTFELVYNNKLSQIIGAKKYKVIWGKGVGNKLCLLSINQKFKERNSIDPSPYTYQCLWANRCILWLADIAKKSSYCHSSRWRKYVHKEHQFMQSPQTEICCLFTAGK